jgi:tRNA dimethylallyltransferase
MKSVIFLMGPTCSGKTGLAIELARRYPIALINVDSAQIYRGLDLGSAKPPAEVLAEFPHALINIADPATPYNASDFCRDARVAIEAAFAAGKIPLLVGGTMMYFKALQEGLSPLPVSSPEVRESIAEEAKSLGWPALHARLATIDPSLAARLKPQDAQRIGRALEVYAMTGEPLSSLQAIPGEPLPYPIKALALFPEDRARLHAEIATRFDAMLAAGFLDEVRGLMQRPDLHPNLPAIRSVGYRQAWEHLSGDYDAATFREKAIAATRQLAKRQLTWLRSWPDCTRLDPYLGDLLPKITGELAFILEKT